MLSEIFEECRVRVEQYDYALGLVLKMVSILYKQTPCEVNMGAGNTIILKILKSSMMLQFVTSLYAMLTYLTLYLCKLEHTMNELMKKAS